MTGSGKLAAWKAPGCAWTVEYAPELMEGVRRHVLEAFFAVPRVGAEAGGVLYGTREGSRVRIAAFRPLECEHRSGPSFTLSPNDHARMKALLVPPAGLAVAGWYHSHTRGEVSLTPEDVELHERYFPQPWQVALLLRPGALVTRAGFFARGADGTLKPGACALEFVVNPAAETAPEAPPPEPESPPAPPQAPPSTPARRRGSRWLSVPLALAIAAAGFFAGRRMTPPAPFALLSADDRGGRLEIRWNAQAPAIREAAAARLEIADGIARPAAVLTPAQLASGVFIYGRRTERVDVRLVLERPGGRRTTESLTFLGPPGPANGALEQELRRARTELLNRELLIRRLERTIEEMKKQRP